MGLASVTEKRVNKPRFSVVIPTLNSPIIGYTIASLKIQKYTDFEVIIVGQDKYNLINESKSIRFITTSEPLPPAAARNIGIKQASGDVIAFLDADCLASPTWLAVLAECYSEPDVYVVGGGVDFARNKYWSLADNISMFYEFMSSAPAGERKLLPSLNLSARRTVFDKVGMFDERYPRPAGEDADLTIRMRKAGFKLHFEPRAVVYHYPSRDTLMDLLRHSFYQGKYSPKIDPRYADEGGIPPLLRNRVGLIAGAPLLAAGALFRMFAFRRDLWHYWYVMPAVYLAKLAWCLGAGSGLWGYGDC